MRGLDGRVMHRAEAYIWRRGIFDMAGVEVGIALVVAFTFLVGIGLAYWQGQKSARAEATTREDELKANLLQLDARHSKASDELKAALQEKGRLQNEAARLDEARTVILEREAQIRSQNAHISEL